MSACVDRTKIVDSSILRDPHLFLMAWVGHLGSHSLSTICPVQVDSIPSESLHQQQHFDQMFMFTKHHPTVGAKCKGGFDKQVTDKQTNDQT